MKKLLKQSANSFPIVIVTLITDDIFFRLKPVCDFLVKRYSEVIIFLFDWSNEDHSHIIEKFQKVNYKVFSFKSIKEGLSLIERFKHCDFLYLVKHTQINLTLLKLLYLFIKTKAKNKWIVQSNIFLIKKIFHKKRCKEFALTLLTSLRNSFLYLLFYLQCFFAYHFFFNPLAKIIKGNPEKKRFDLADLKNILFIRMDHLGDIICTLPLLKTLKENLPKSKITFLGASWSCEPLKANPHLYDELIIWDAPWHNKKKNYKVGIKEFIKFMVFIPKLWKKNFDLVIQPRGEEMNVILAAFSKGRFIVSGIDKKRPLAIFMSKWIDMPVFFNPYKTYHISEWPELCLKRLGIKISKAHIEGVYKSYDFSEIQDQIMHWKKQGFKICALVIGAGSRVRLWKANKFSMLIEELYKRKIACVLIGSKGDIKFKNKIKIDIPVLDFVGKSDFRSLECLLRYSDFVITLDTSVMHLASLLRKKIIALFGAGNIDLAKPIFNDKAYIIKKELGCSGCGDICLFKKRAPCMEMIFVKDVLNIITSCYLA